MPQTTTTPPRPRKTALPKLIEKYYADLKDLAHQNVMYEMGTSDPNRQDDPEYIVRLVGQLIHVSLETVKVVKALPAEYADSAVRSGKSPT